MHVLDLDVQELPLHSTLAEEAGFNNQRLKSSVASDPDGYDAGRLNIFNTGVIEVWDYSPDLDLPQTKLARERTVKFFQDKSPQHRVQIRVEKNIYP